MKNNSDKYPKNMNIKTFSIDCFDGATETKESIKMKEKYLKKFHQLSREFVQDCINNQVESISQVGFFFAWLWPEFVNASIEVCYEHLHKAEGGKKVYKFEKADYKNP